MLKKLGFCVIFILGLASSCLYATIVDVTNPPYNADNTGVTDAQPAIQAALNSGASKVLFPAGVYRVDSGLTLSGGTNTDIILQGEGKKKSILQTSANITMISGGSLTSIRDLGFLQTSSSRVGTALNIYSLAYCDLHRLTIYGFDKGITATEGLWSSFRDLILKDNNIGIELQGNGSQWNVDWFHNQISFDNVLCQGGEIGIKASCMGITFNNVTTQWQKESGLGYVPSGKGTGIWLEGPANTILGKARNNVIINHYAEGTQRPIYIKNSYDTTIIGAFAQGGYPDPYPCWLEAENAVIDLIGSVNGLDKFSVSAILTNATLYGDCKAGFDVDSSSYVTLNTGGIYKRNGRAFADNMNCYLSFNSAGNQEMDYPLTNYHHYRINIGGLYDGYLMRYSSYKLFRFNSDSTTKIVADSNNSTDISLSVSNSKPVITVTGNMRYYLYITIEDVSSMSGKHTNKSSQNY